MFQRLPVKPSEREKLFSEFHKLRCNKDIENKFVQAFECESIPKVKVYFFQMFINALLQGVLDEILLYHKSCDDFKQYISNESEQQILFYICGFILNKLKKMSCKVLAPFSDVISSFYDKNVQNLEFVKNVSAWTQKLDRGGLKYPSKYFFFRVREVDLCINRNLDFDNLNSTSLSLDHLLPIIFDSYLVKYYFVRLVETYPDRDCDILLRYIVKLFVTVKGFAIAKRARNKFCSNSRSNSLRGSLKNEIYMLYE